jgi:amicyanin
MINRPRSVVCLVAAAAALTTALAGCGSSDSGSGNAASTASLSAPAGSKTVDVKNMAFAPSTITVHVGDTVTWKFEDRFPHSVHGVGQMGMVLNSPIFNTGQWSWTFTAPGEYDYNCQQHPEMTGKVIVE